MIIYLFGQPGSGKTTLADYFIRKQIFQSPFTGYTHLDGDVLRRVFKDVDYSKDGRIKNIQRAMDIALYLEKTHNVIPVCSVASPFRSQRQWLHKQTNLVEVHLHHNVNERPKKEYQIESFEPPLEGDNCISINTSEHPLSICYEKLLQHISGTNN